MLNLYKNMTILLTLSAALIALPPVAFARCACLDSVDQTRLQIQEEMNLRRLPSEASREVARSFMRQSLYQDAWTYLQQAAQKALAEIDSAANGRTPATAELSEAARRRHTVEVLTEAGEFAKTQGKLRDAANYLEQALKQRGIIDPEFDASEQLQQLAQLFHQLGDNDKASEYAAKHASLLASRHGRYDERTKAAMRIAEAYRRRTP